MKEDTTERGFSYVKFKDEYGNDCSLQKSSSAMQDCVWLGCDKLGVKEFVAFRQPSAWRDMTELDEFSYEKHYVGNNRMHLTREQVKELLPHLQKFVETGEI